MKAVKNVTFCQRSHKHYNGRCQTKTLVSDYLYFVLYQYVHSKQTDLYPYRNKSQFKIPFYSCMTIGMTLISVYSFEKGKKTTIS